MKKTLGIPSEHPARWMLLGAAMAIQENGLVKREQSDARISSAEREDGRPKVNGTEVMDWLAMLRGGSRREAGDDGHPSVFHS